MNKTFRETQRVNMIAALKNFFPSENATVLDVGAGNGEFTRLVENALPNLKFSGIEVLDRGAPQIPITMYDGEKFPFADKSFDYVMYINMLHHTSNPEQLITEGLRVARQGIIIKDHYADNWLDNATLTAMEYANPNAKALLQRGLRFYSRREWREKFQRLGLTCEAYDDKFSSYGKFWDIFFGRKMHFIGRYSKPS